MAIQLDGTTGISASGNIQGANLVTAGNVTATGNVAGNYFIGNGAALTGIVASGGAAITNGSSNVSIGGAGANVTVGVAGVGNVAVFSSTDLTISGNLLPAGNVNKNIGSPTNAFNDLYLANSTIFLGNATISANATSVIMTNESGQQTVITGSGTLTSYGNVVSAINTTANITGGNIITAGIAHGATVSATSSVIAPTITTTGGTGNISGANYVNANYFVGNGSLLTSLPGGTAITNGTSTVAIGASGVNANVTIGGTSNVAVFASTGLTVTGTASATGTITGGNVITNGNISVGGTVQGNSATNSAQILNYKDAVVTITYASTITPNIALGSIQQVTLTGPVTMNAFGGTPQAGQSMVIKFIQDATGGRTLSSTMKWAGGAKTLSTAANAVDIASVFYDGSTYYASLTLAYA